MASHKRKGRDVFDDDVLASPAPAVVIVGSSPSLTMADMSPAFILPSPFSPSPFAGGGGGSGALFSPVSSSFGKNRDPIERIRNRLKEFQANYSPPTTPTDENDPVLTAIENIKKDHNSQDENLKQLELQSKTIQDQLKEQIRQAKDACQQESNVLSEMANKLQALQDKRKSLMQDMEQLDALQEDLQSRIELHKEEASQEIEEIDLVEEERKRLVPRLKTQISLYATTTGIKWDYSVDQDQNHILSGKMVRTYRR
jgi:uncharacterized phage infection (PIP) family protein YhgE